MISKSTFLKYISRIPILDLWKQASIIRNEELENSIRGFTVASLIISLSYFVFPIDIIPDILLGFGYMDDLAIYGVLREIGYTGAEENCGVKDAIKITFKSKLFKIFVVLSVLIMIITLILFYLI